jgi:hypothetical protein
MKHKWNGLVSLLFVGGVSCASGRAIRYEPAQVPPEKPAARIFLVGDGGIVSFEESKVPEKTDIAEQKVEERAPAALPLPPLPPGWRPWARPPGGEKKAFDDIVNETITLAIKAARTSDLLMTLRLDAAERSTLAPDAPAPLIVWLGDNVYDHGVPRYPGANGYKDGQLTPVGYEYVQAATCVLVQAQVAIDAKADAVFVAGNHDWDSAVTQGPEGRERVIEEGLVIERWIKTLRQHNPDAVPPGVDVRLLPKGGCPGPEVVRLPIGGSASAIVAAVDTEWLISEDPNKGCVAGGNCRACEPSSHAKVYEALNKVARAASERDVMIVAAHHPIRTYGVHGGNIFWSPASWPRWLPLSQEDMAHPRNKAMVRGLKSAWDPKNGQPLLYAAGHEHNLQLLRESERGPYVAVSGAASKTSPVRAGSKALFTAQKNGYMVLDLYADGRVQMRIVEVASEKEVLRHPPVELRGPMKSPAN